MAIQLITMYALMAATANAVAQVDIPEDGAIVGVDWTMAMSSGLLDADSMAAQLSFISTAQFATNDARGAISHIAIGVGTLTTSGVAGVTANKFVSFIEPLTVASGERLYLHSKESGTAQVDCWAIIHLKTRIGTVRRSQRRR